MQDLQTQIIEAALRYQELISVAAGVLVFLLMWWLIVRRPRRKSDCKWRRDKAGHRASLTKWTCKSCGAEAFSATTKPPNDCKRQLKPRAL